jgi:hypothetical protein
MTVKQLAEIFKAKDRARMLRGEEQPVRKRSLTGTAMSIGTAMTSPGPPTTLAAHKWSPKGATRPNCQAQRSRTKLRMVHADYSRPMILSMRRSGTSQMIATSTYNAIESHGLTNARAMPAA